MLSTRDNLLLESNAVRQIAMINKLEIIVTSVYNISKIGRMSLLNDFSVHLLLIRAVEYLK